MDTSQISHLIEPQTVDSERIAASVQELESELISLPETAYEDRGTIYYYLIRLKLHKNSLLEDEKVKEYVREMRRNFSRHEEQTLSGLRDKTVNTTMKSITRLQLSAFYKLIQSYGHKLEKEFAQKGFEERKAEVYHMRRRFGESSFAFHGQHGKKLLYLLWRLTSNYGESFMRWGTTNLIAILCLSTLFFIIGTMETPEHPMLKENPIVSGVAFFNYVYYSIITFTTVGYGDISPVTTIERAIGMVEALMGYLLLGIFLTLLQRKL